jgi:BirA family transcriptional regulator, biotin operon repressor / biotin---[acetyl-CoA-carboxylase] ligase
MSSGALGRPRVHHRLTDSTNARARELAMDGAAHGTLVTAGEQTAGRGRSGRTWWAAPGGAVLMSLVLRGLDERHAMVPLAAAVAACEACEAHAPVDCAIKWPNDIWIDGRKLAGILVEGRPQEGWAVLGIGLNVATGEHELPEDLRTIATSLAIATSGRPPAVEAVLTELLERLAVRLDAPAHEILGAWRARDALMGTTVRWQLGEGRAAGIDDSGALLVDTGAGRVSLASGEVHLTTSSA